MNGMKVPLMMGGGNFNGEIPNSAGGNTSSK
jgi:hypothetical protein